MPRRTYNPSKGRGRPHERRGDVVERLQADLGRRPYPPDDGTRRPCASCGRSMPPNWPHREHAPCHRARIQEENR